MFGVVMSRLFLVRLAVLLLVCESGGCQRQSSKAPAAKPQPKPALPARSIAVPPPEPVKVAPLPMLDPVPLWEHGRSERYTDAAYAAQNRLLILDLGESWAPYLFSDGVSNDGKPLPNTYRPTYLALARGEFPDDRHGQRARVDKYLELYGIMPTLRLMRERMRAMFQLSCVDSLDRTPLEGFTKVVTYSNQTEARKRAAQYDAAKARVLDLMQLQAAATPDAFDLGKLSKRDLSALKFYLDETPQHLALEAVQERLRCEGYLAGRGKVISGVMDWATHEALAEFERRNRVYSFGYLARESLGPLRQAPKEVEREAVLRVLTERALHAAGVLEDGSLSATSEGQTLTYVGRDGQEHPIPNLVAAVRETLIESFGLHTPELTLAWLESLGDLPKDQHLFVAVPMVELPEYYGPEMELALDYDRGDIWYEFPYDDKGQEVAQPVSRRPQVTVSTLYNGQKIPLARFGTTIGGWRTEVVNGTVMYRYKESPVGPRAWDEIVAAPVWMPPDGTEPDGLLIRNDARTSAADPEFVVNYHETGPSYASAYGLVAAYHRTYLTRAGGRIALGHDEGIRTHGSVDYMSIMRRHSHGCHRLHNHIALRLMSFVLAHRPHERAGQVAIGYKRFLAVQGKSYVLDLPQGGYVFKLNTPVLVNVEPGRIRGSLKVPVEIAIPKFNAERGGYVMPDGRRVVVRGNQLVAASSVAASSSVARKGTGAILSRTAGGVRVGR